MVPIAVASSEQPHSSDKPNVVPGQIHLVLNPDELATIVIALRAIELHGFAERFDAILRLSNPSRQPAFNGSPTDYAGAVIHSPEQLLGDEWQSRNARHPRMKAGMAPVPPTMTGQKLTTVRPHPFSHAEFAHLLLIVRGRVRAAKEHVDATQGE